MIHILFVILAVEYCRELRAENKKLQKETEKMKEEISKLTAEIRYVVLRVLLYNTTYSYLQSFISCKETEAHPIFLVLSIIVSTRMRCLPQV